MLRKYRNFSNTVIPLTPVVRQPIPALANAQHPQGVALRVLRYAQLQTEKGVNYSRTHIARLEKEGSFPKRIKLGANSVAWVEKEVDVWLNKKKRARAA